MFNSATNATEEILLIEECSNNIMRNIERNIANGKFSKNQRKAYQSIKWYLSVTSPRAYN